MESGAAEELIHGGRYRLVGKLGEGSQGTTFDAVDEKSGARVAVKRFVIKGSKSWKDVELAEREATVLSSLSHPSLPVYVDHFEEGGALYLVMQKIEGENLASIAKRGAILSQEDVVRFLSEAAVVLDYLHGRSPPVIHRDINPKNVIRRPDGSYVLVDFGAVRDKLKPEGGSTVVGTFGYMATEQFQGRALPASDVYSVGATAIRMLTGTEPENLPHKGLGIDVPAALGRSVDSNLAEALAKMLDPDPDRRARSITPLVDKMKRAAARGPAYKQDSRGRRRDSGERRAYGWGHEETEEAFHRAREAREEAEYVARKARDDAFRTAREIRRQARDERRARKRARRGRYRPPIFFPMAILINVAMLVVGIMLGAVVPFVLVILSIFFGKPLRDAARSVREAGRSTQAALSRAQAFVMNESVPEDRRKESTTEEQRRVRVDPEAPPRVRVSDEEDVIDTEGAEAPEERAHRRG
jgi:Protein kinase domain